MKPEFKKIWVDALRSGKYQQGYGNLKTNQGDFCCLGVLLDTVGCQWDIQKNHLAEEARIFAKDETGKVLSRKDPDNGEIEGYLSQEMLDKFGLDHSIQTDLANRNDGVGTFFGNRQGFEQIANYIEETL